MTKPEPFDNIYGGNDRPTDQIGAWQYFDGTLRDAIAIDGANKPFIMIGPYGGYTWQDGNKTMMLEMNISPTTTSGYVSIKLNNGWMAQFLVTSENNDFFEDASQRGTKDGVNVTKDWRTISGSQMDLDNHEYPTVWIQDDAEFTDSRAFFVLDGDNGDYLSFDVDGESDRVAQARIKLDGSNYIANTEMNNEVFIRMVWLRRWDADYPSIDELALLENDTTTVNPPPVTEDDLDTEKTCLDGYTWDDETLSCVLDNTGGGNGGGNGGEEEQIDSSMLWILGLGFVTLVAIGFVTMKGE